MLTRIIFFPPYSDITYATLSRGSHPDETCLQEKERKERQLVKVNLRSSLSKCHVAAIHSALGAPGRCRDGGCHLPSSYHSS